MMPSYAHVALNALNSFDGSLYESDGSLEITLDVLAIKSCLDLSDYELSQDLANYAYQTRKAGCKDSYEKIITNCFNGGY